MKMANDREFSCSECSYTTDKKQYHLKHCRTHTGELQYQCDECGKAFYNKRDLKKHSFIHLKDMLVCDLCDSKFTRKCNLTRHYQLKHAEKDPLLDNEAESCPEKEGAGRHEDGKFYCPLCSYSTFYSSSFENHCVIHTGEKPFECENCKKAFRTNSTLLRHVRSVHTAEQHFPCATCGAAFKRSDGLRRHHRRVHDRPKPVSEKADAKKESVSEVVPASPTPKEDSQQALQKKDKRFRCSECSYSCNRSVELKKHFRVHSGEKPYKCSQCDKAFATKSVLTRHFLIHDGHSPFTCTICSKTFRRKDNYRMHWKTHGLKDPFPASLLKKANEDSKTSNVAEDIGTLPKRKRPLIRHRCPECPYSNNRYDRLRHHLRIHSDERPFQCEQCEEAFVMKIQLLRHIRAHAGKRPFVCGTCDQRFVRRDCLRKHEESHSRQLIKLVDEDEVHTAPSSPTTSEDHQKPPGQSHQKHRCPECNYSTNQRRKLDDHVVTHLFAKPFICDQCGQAFRKNALLRRHLCTRQEVGTKKVVEQEKSHLQDPPLG